ncbi:MAG: ABC transporter ATP-binding protein [Chloroflexi bacterium]|nr:ABC transporter ATP-binding protein [Chloroflexota bacterium]
MIAAQSLTFGYTPNSPIFQGFNWQVQRGETWAILGSSGCGKTTLLYLLAGLRIPTHGRIEIDGERLTRPRPNSGLILQDYGLLPWATVRENAGLGLRVRGFYGDDGKHTPKNFQPENRVEYWLERLGLNEVADKYPSQISGGQRQRTAIARTLALSPDLLLMDEPFSSLDAITREDLQYLTLSLCEEQKLTLVIVTHSIEEAASLGGKILLVGASPRVFENPHVRDDDYRNSGKFRDLCDLLWKEMRGDPHPALSRGERVEI